jgi:hypothetical protein
MGALVSRIRTETEAAEYGLIEAIGAYFPDVPSPVEPRPDDPFEPMQENLKQVDEALLELRQATDKLQSAGQPVEPVLGMLAQLKPLVKAIQMPSYEAKWTGCYTQMAARENQKALDAAEQARTTLLSGKPAGLSSFRQTYERALYLEALLQRMRALMMLGWLKERRRSRQKRRGCRM